MKKALRVILPVLMIGIVFSSQTVNGDYLVTVGSIFNYDVIDSNMSVTFGVNTASGTGFEIANTTFAAGTTVELNVTALDSLGVDYNLTAGAFTEEKSSSVWDSLGMALLTIFPLFVSLGIATTEWDQNATEDTHAGLLLVPFLDVDNSSWEPWSIWADMADSIHANGTTAMENITTSLVWDATYDNTSTDFIFETHLSGEIADLVNNSGSLTQVNLTIEHRYQFAYTIATGVMLGIRMVGEVTGFVNGTIFEMNYNYLTEKAGYDMPIFELYSLPTWPFPGFEYLIAIGALASLAIPIVLVKKRRK